MGKQQEHESTCQYYLSITSHHHQEQFLFGFTDPNVSCEDPDQITNATRSGTSFNYRDTITYSCNIGYVRKNGLNGDITLTCGLDGQWTGRDTCTCKSLIMAMKQYLKGPNTQHSGHMAQNIQN